MFPLLKGNQSIAPGSIAAFPTGDILTDGSEVGVRKSVLLTPNFRLRYQNDTMFARRCRSRQRRKEDVVTATFVSPVRQQQNALGGDAENMLVVLGKDRRLIPYGGGNFGMPLELMEPDGDVIVPTERFFMRSNGPVPIVDPETWSMSVTGRVDRPLHLRLDDLQTMPRRTLTAFLECAGNGRTRFVPVPDGTPWSNDAAGTRSGKAFPFMRYSIEPGFTMKPSMSCARGVTSQRCSVG